MRCSGGDKVRADLPEIIRRLRETDVRIVALLKEYKVAFYVLREAVLSQLGEGEYRAITRQRQGPQRTRKWVQVECAGCQKILRRPLPLRRYAVCSRDCEVRVKQRGRLVPCAYCGAMLYRGLLRLERHPLSFCSMSHQSRYQKQRAGILPQRLIKCENPHCGKEFFRDESKIAPHDRHYCSRACAGAVNRDQMTVACSECGRIVERPPSEYLIYLHHFCDEDCRAQWQHCHGGIGRLASHEQISQELRIICRKIEFCQEYEGRMRDPSFYKLLQQMSRRLTQWIQTAGLMDRELKDTVAQTLRRVRQMI